MRSRTFATDAADAAAAEGCGKISHQESIDPNRATANNSTDTIGALVYQVEDQRVLIVVIAVGKRERNAVYKTAIKRI